MNKGDIVQIPSNIANTTVRSSPHTIKTDFTEKISKEEANDLRTKIEENTTFFALKSTNIQGKLVSSKVDFKEAYADMQKFLKDVGYEGKPIAELSKEEAGALVAKDGFFGIDKTAERIADFVINGAAGDEDRLRSGKAGMLQGFREAEAMWGKELPEISQKSMHKALEIVDKEMSDLGFSILNKKA